MFFSYFTSAPKDKTALIEELLKKAPKLTPFAEPLLTEEEREDIRRRDESERMIRAELPKGTSPRFIPVTCPSWGFK